MTTDDSIIKEQQRLQQKHDIENHFDIVSSTRIDRVKHYALHYAKYVGRMFRENESKHITQTLTDSLLVSLSAANALNQSLWIEPNLGLDHESFDAQIYADYSGIFADSAEKIDHMESFLEAMKGSNYRLFWLAFQALQRSDVDPVNQINKRRIEISKRAVYADK